MPSRSSGHAAVGIGSGALGAIFLGAGAFRVGPLRDGSFAGSPYWVLALVAGAVLALAGGLVLVFTFRGEEEVLTTVPAHVAFRQRMTVEEVVPPPAPRAGTGALSSSSARLPSPELPAQRRVAPARDDLASLDAQIRDLTKKISKAGVMLATGQLSQQGYLAYVEDLKRQRGKLEASRVRAELK